MGWFGNLFGEKSADSQEDTTLFNLLKKLISLDKNKDIFGANSLKYVINPPMTTEAIEQFEQQHRVQIPSDYRDYLLTIGDVGAGPFYGLMRLEDNDGITVDLSSPFPYQRNHPLLMADIYQKIDDATADMDDAAAEEYRGDMLDEIYTSIDKGIVYLAHEGCGMYSVLVLNGEEYGNVWYVDVANDAGVFPLTDPETGKSMTFSAWYRLWLSSAYMQLNEGKKGLLSFSTFITE